MPWNSSTAISGCNFFAQKYTDPSVYCRALTRSCRTLARPDLHIVDVLIGDHLPHRLEQFLDGTPTQEGEKHEHYSPYRHHPARE